MRWHRYLTALAALLIAVVGLGGVTNGASASPHITLTLNPPKEATKVILGETSIDGPALWTQRGPSYPVGPTAVLAWTGPDGRLTYLYTNDGLSFFGKTTLHETSFVRPAVVRGVGEGGQARVAPVALAWTGTDRGHHLNVLYELPGSGSMKLTLWNETSFAAPALEWIPLTGNKTLLLAWSGTDRNHSLNILPITITSHELMSGTKTTIWGYHSLGQPALITDLSMTSQTRFFLSWSDLTSHRIAWATSPDGKSWTQQPTFSETSGAGPSTMGLTQQLAHIPPYWLGWTGTDAAHHVNVLYANTLSRWPVTFAKATLPETAVGGTVVGFVLAPPDQQILVAWTGTDSLHHLNVARVGV